MSQALACLLLCALALSACTRARPEARDPARAESQAPVAAQRPHRVKAPFGERDDPYYWMRDDTRSAPDVLAYLKAEDAYAERQLQPLRAARDALYRELVARMPKHDESVPVRKGGYLYWTRFVADGEYPMLLRRRPNADAAEQVLLDENQLARGAGYFDVATHEVSPDGKVLAWAEDRVGRGQHTIRFKNLETGAIYTDTLPNADPALAWASDSQTLLYVEKDPETLLGSRVRSHRLGSDPTSDPVVYEEHDHSFYLTVWRSRSGRYLHIYLMATDVSEQWAARADDPTLHFSPLIARAPGHEYRAEDHGDGWIVRSNQGAPNFRLFEVARDALAQRERWGESVAEPAQGLLEDFLVFREFVAYTARSAGRLRAFVLPFSAQSAREVELPGQSYTVSLGENPEPESASVRLEYSALAVPDSVYSFDVSSATLRLLKREPVLGGFDPEHYVNESLRAPARDGASIPVSLAYRKDVARDGRAALYLLGYGAYGASDDPEFQSARVSLLQRGVVLAIAHVRGGQELGRAWYEQGRKLAKHHTFEDFIDVTDFLTAHSYAARERVAARGASAGGLLIGAIANMAPERYAALVAHVPFVDVVTTMLDDSIPLTSNEYDEWGDPRREADYRNMLSYSPYDNVRHQRYPALFVSTSLWDSQVQYYEPAKWVARLRAAKTDENPLVFRVNMAASHGGRSGRFARLVQLADEYAFVLDRLRVRL